MAKDDNMPTKKEIIQFLERVEQLNEDDNVFKEKLGGLLRKIVGKTATQNDTSPIRHDTKSENHLLSNSKLTELEQRIHAIQQDNDNLGQKITQLKHTNKKLEEENMGILDLFKRKEQDVSHLQQQISGLSQDNQKLKQNNESLSTENQDLNKKLEIYASENKITFINLNPIFAPQKVLKKEFTADDLHLNGSAYKLWAQEIKKYF